MLTLNGTIINIFESPRGTNKEGKEYGGEHRVQVLAETVLRNGEKRADLVNLTVDDVRPYADLRGKDVRVPVGVFSSAKGISFYALKGCQPELAVEGYNA